MKKVINIPDTEMGLRDNFQDFFKRLGAEIKTHMISGTNLVCGPLELETIDNFLEAFKYSEPVESVTDFADRCRICGKTSTNLDDESDHMHALKQYYFDRDSFTKTFKEVFGDRIVDVEIACQEGKSTSSFLLHYDEGEYYIIHLESGTIINWYKHIGCANTCNNDKFTLTNLRLFLMVLKCELFTERGK